MVGEVGGGSNEKSNLINLHWPPAFLKQFNVTANVYTT